MAKQTLAAALAVIGREEYTLESKADNVLAIVKSAGIRDVKAFNLAVREAYKANGWNVGAGKPKGPKLQAVPATVKQYVSRIRAAFNLELPIQSFRTFHQLRKALKDRAPRPATAANDPVMAGLRLTRQDELVGAPFHDLTAIYSKLDKARQTALVQSVNRLVRQYQSAAPQLQLVPLAKAA